MKKTHILLMIALMVVLLVAALQVVTSLSGVVPYWKCSDLYKQYSNVEGVRATYVKDYKLNDTLVVGVTLLEATDSAGWVRLKKDFAINPYSDTIRSYITNNSFQVKFIPKGNPLLPMDTVLTNNDIMVVKEQKRLISIFDIRAEEQIDAIYQYVFDFILISNEKNND